MWKMERYGKVSLLPLQHCHHPQHNLYSNSIYTPKIDYRDQQTCNEMEILYSDQQTESKFEIK